jgi:hypothetical protein
MTRAAALHGRVQGLLDEQQHAFSAAAATIGPTKEKQGCALTTPSFNTRRAIA